MNARAAAVSVRLERKGGGSGRVNRGRAAEHSGGRREMVTMGVGRQVAQTDRQTARLEALTSEMKVVVGRGR
jgi:hypothetical protein